ncbi:MAG TPA: hypothetical protein VG456_20635 [Candidatus Sulfopaludibacter sp.]|jgi:hypothetical protein|nr:hypothetical protein [Candidatus Sulfopaludibacter sp.]
MTLHLAMLRAASWLVPAAERAEWLEEWQAELCYVGGHLTSFCLGAFRDAFWIRRNTGDFRITVLSIESPWRCLAALTLLALAGIFFAFRLLPSSLPNARRLAVVYAVQPDQYRRLAAHADRHFAALAFYQTRREPLGTVAFATANLFDTLEFPLAAAPGLVLSRSLWKAKFAADPHILGRLIDVAGVTAPVAAVVDVDLPGRVDAWMLLNDTTPLPGGKGFILARLAAPAALEHWRTGVDGERFDFSSLAPPNFFFVAGLHSALAFLIVAMTTPLSLGDYPPRRSLRRWAFFAVKLILVQIAVCCATLDFAAIFEPGVLVLLVALILAVRWALADQRNRCPVCLRLLTSPTRIGGPSHVFLDWYGTELICAHGHGLLYVPEIPTSSCTTQRWQHLDSSWSTLFS